MARSATVLAVMQAAELRSDLLDLYKPAVLACRLAVHTARAVRAPLLHLPA